MQLGLWHRIRPLCAASWLLLFLAGCSSGSAPKAATLVKPGGERPQTVLLITIDTWRQDAWSFLGGTVATPNLDGLAAEGVVFANAYAHHVVTLPSHASMLTGLFGYGHGLRDNAGYRMEASQTTLAHLMKQAGYATGAFISAFPLDARYGLGHGFDHYDDAYDAYHGEGNLTVPTRPGVHTLAAARKWLQAHAGQPAFAWVHLYEPHFPYTPPEPFRSQYPEAPYLGEVAYSDALLAPLIEDLAGQNALVVVTSDHGESLGEHGEETHGLFAYDATLAVPLFFWAPNHLKPGVIDDLARHVDLLPSLLQLLDMDPPKGIHGQSLFSTDFKVAPSYFESLTAYLNRGWAPLRGCVDENHKAIDLPQLELYDLAKDPGEQNNLALEDTERALAFLTCLPAEVGLETGRGTLSQEEIENLQALGYVTGAFSEEAEGAVRPDPKDMIRVDQQLQSALALSQTNRLPLAIQTLEGLTKAHPQVAIAYFHLADFYQKSRQQAMAVNTMKRAIANGVQDETAFRKLALFLMETGEPGEAFILLQPFQDSQDPETHSALGKAHTALGRFGRAKTAFDTALRLDPENPKVLAELGTLHLYTQQASYAKTYFQRALTRNPKLADAWNGMGVILAGERRDQEAIEAWENAISFNPNLAFCHYNLAIFYDKYGLTERAIERLQSYLRLAAPGEQKQKAEQMLRRLQGL